MVLMAVLGGVARQAHQTISGKKFRLVHVWLRGVISVFIGVVWFWIAKWKVGSEPLPAIYYALDSLFGWLGADGVLVLVRLITRSIFRNGADDEGFH